LEKDFQYDGPLFDAHSHAADEAALRLMVEIGSKFGVEKSLLILHTAELAPFREMYPGRFVFARFFLNTSMGADNFSQVRQEVVSLRDQGYSLAKTHFAPFWRDRIPEGGKPIPPVQDDTYDSFFDLLSDLEIPVVIHISDPDTYYATKYSNSQIYGTKESHISEFEKRLSKNQQLRFQAAHFGAQPEQPRLENLGRMFDTYPNLYVDTGSARWMARELGKNVKKAKAFVTRYSRRILFGTDCVARTLERDYYEGRFLAERLLWESNVRGVPLPFVDEDTKNSGGTFINGLSLPQAVLKRIYWENALALYQS
jgi:predicted TIM-barrel fold metal-dependent hydrolase